GVRSSTGPTGRLPACSRRRRSRRMALTITSSTEPSWTSMPMAMVTPPANTPASSATTVISAMAMFCRITETVLRARPMACGSVVDAVADHRDGVALVLELGDDGELVLGQQLGADLVHPDLGGDRLCHPAIVTGKHDDLLHAVRVQSGDHLLRIGAELVGDRDHADHAAVESDDHRGASESGEPVDLRGRTAVLGAIGRAA